MLKDIDAKGGMRELSKLDFADDFERQWARYSSEEQRAIVEAIEEKLDELVAAPDALWGSIMNTSIEGGKANPFTGTRGDWDGTPWAPIYEKSGHSEQHAALFFGTLWKWRIIEHPQQWIGIRNDPDVRPTFPNRGVALQGKTYFLAKRP